MQGKATGRRAPLGNQRSLAEGKSNGLGWVSKNFHPLEALFPGFGSLLSNHWKGGFYLVEAKRNCFCKRTYDFLSLLKKDTTFA